MSDDARGAPTLATAADHVERLRALIPGAHPSTWSATVWATLYRGYIFVAGILAGEVQDARQSSAQAIAHFESSMIRDKDQDAKIADAHRRIDAMAEVIKKLEEKLDAARAAFVELRDGKKSPTKEPKGKS